MSGSATSFVGPLAIGLVTSLSQSRRAGFAGGVIFLAVGLALLLKVKEPVGSPTATDQLADRQWQSSQETPAK